MVTKKKTSRQLTTGFAPTPEDLKLLAELKTFYESKLGYVTNAQLLRMGLRALAAKEGLAA